MAPLGDAAPAGEGAGVGGVEGEPSVEQAQDLSVGDVLAQQLAQGAVLNAVEEGVDVGVHQPVQAVGDALAGADHGHVHVARGAVAEAVVVEQGLADGLQDAQQHALGELVAQTQGGQGATPATGLGDGELAHGLGPVGAAAQVLDQLRDVAHAVGLHGASRQTRDPHGLRGTGRGPGAHPSSPSRLDESEGAAIPRRGAVCSRRRVRWRSRRRQARGRAAPSGGMPSGSALGRCIVTCVARRAGGRGETMSIAWLRLWLP
jgi:hypothetical protein